MIRITLCILILFTGKISYSQEALVFSPVEFDFVEINPGWVVKNRVNKIIEREYLSNDLNKVHLVNVLYFNNKGYLRKKIIGQPYPKENKPNEIDFSTISEYTYEEIDSFLYQKELIIRNFNQNGRLTHPDTLREVYKNNYNIYNKKWQKIQNEVLAEYIFDKNNKLLEIKNLNAGKKINLKYKKSKLVSGKVEWNKNLPFLSNEKVVFKYNNKQLIEEIQIFDNNNNHKSASKFFYDDQNQVIWKELLLQGRTVAIHTFDYTKNN